MLRDLGCKVNDPSAGIEHGWGSNLRQVNDPSVITGHGWGSNLYSYAQTLES